MTILIAGGGIGGLTAALSLHAAGMADLQVLEASPSIEAVGVGINLPPHATRELTELGLADKLAQLGIQTSHLSYYDPSGHLIWTEPRGLSAGYRWPQYSLHRGQLQRILLEAVHQRLGAASVQTGCRVLSVHAAAGELQVTFRNSGGGEETTSPTLLIGADGIRSVVRESLFPASMGLAWNGWVMWRGVTCASPFLDGATMVIVGDELQRVVVYPIMPASRDKPAMLNWIVSRRAEDDAPDRGNWNKPVDPAALAKFVDGWSYDWIDIPALIANALAVYEYPMVDLDPLPQWTQGRATLLGDAAHAMYPFGSNGASQAIIDARVLARELASSSDPGAALLRYENLRREPVAKVQEANRRQASDVMTRVSELARRQVFAGAADELIAVERDYKRLASFEAESLNERPSWSVTAPAAAADR
jgi:5-methylphenazine-1-carboxylate 1-monooxygenase